MLVFLSLGSNLGDRMDNIRRALCKLAERGARVKAVSSLYETEPLNVPSSQPHFLNAVAQIHWSADLISLLDLAEAIEREMGRKEKGTCQARVIDIDILWAEGVRHQSDRLTVPHPRLWERAFVLIPLSELVSHLNGTDIKSVACQLAREQFVKIYSRNWWGGQTTEGSPDADL